MESWSSKLLAATFSVLTSAALAPGVHAQVGSLPRLDIDLVEGAIPDEPKVTAYLTLTAGDSIDYARWIGIELRGRSSLAFDQKGYGFETREEDGDNRNVSLLGMPPENDWALHGPYANETYLRNALAYTTARAIGAPAPRSRFCALRLDGEPQGIYLLVEKIKRDDGRVAMEKLSADGREGDFMVEAAGFQAPTPPGVRTDGYFVSDVSFVPDGVYTVHPRCDFSYPRPRDITRRQAEAMQAWFDETAALSQADDGSPAFDRFLERVDVASLADLIIVQEVAKNVDAYILSTYFVRRGGEGGRLYAGPVWDFNFVFGNADYVLGESTQDLRVLTTADGVARRAPLNFYEPPAFREALESRWRGYRAGALSDVAVAARVDGLLSEILPAIPADTALYEHSGEYLTPNEFVGSDVHEDITYLRKWLSDRLAYLDSVWGSAAQPADERLTHVVYPNPLPCGTPGVSRTDTFSTAVQPFVVRDISGRTIDEGILQPGLRDHPLHSASHQR